MGISVLLLGCGGNAGINFTKCLKLASTQYKVIGVDIDPYKLAASNADVKILYDETKNHKLELITKLIRLYDIKVIHAQPDAEVEWLINHQRYFSNLVFPHDIDKKRNFDNKALTAKIWNEYFKLDFRSNKLTDCIEDPSKFTGLVNRAGRAWIRAIKGAGSKGALPVGTLEQAVSWAEYWATFKGVPVSQFMVSEYLPGREYAVQFFYIKGFEIQSQMRERLVPFFQNQMPSGQSSTPAVARICYSKEVYEMANRAVRQFDSHPHGIYSVDLKESYQGTIVPIEVNYGRFFTTSDFFAHVGVNTPDAYVQYILDGSTEYRIRQVRDEIYWLRGLDTEPVLKRKDEIEWKLR